MGFTYSLRVEDAANGVRGCLMRRNFVQHVRAIPDLAAYVRSQSAVGVGVSGRVGQGEPASTRP